MSDTSVVKSDEVKGLEMFEKVRERCTKLMGEEAFLREASFALQIIGQSPALQQCTAASKLQAMLNVANTGLTLNPLMKLCYLIPRNVKVKVADGSDRWDKRCAVEPSYIGLMKVATDTGSVKHFDAQVVYKGDDFTLNKGTKEIRHVPYWSLGRERGEIVGAYAVATLSDGSVNIEDMGADELALIRSKSDNANGSVYTDWSGEMARKALLKRQSKYLPKSDRNEALMRAIAMDDEGYELSGQTAEQRGMKALKDRVREALDFYPGEDREELREQCRAKIATGEFTEAFARNILDAMGVAA